MDLSFPSFICNHFPPVFLNGELWCGRGGFTQAQQMIHSLNEFDFSCLRIMVFDDAKPGKFFKRTFESRYRSLVDNVDSSHPLIILAPRIKCESESVLNLFVRNILSDGGEGVILRRPRSVYEHGRSNHLVKIKASRADREALVVSVHSNELVLKLPSGVTFTVPALEEQGKVKKGDIVTCSYDQVTSNSIPIDPKITKIRSDITWKDVLLNSDSLSSNLSESSQKLFPEAKNNLVATINNNKRRKFFENFAKQNNLDPLVPETWYSVSRQAITSIKESASVLAPFKYSVVRALVQLFPEIVFDESKFTLTQRAHWINLTHRKQFFDDFAKRNNFDPLVPENWHSVFSDPIMATKGVSSVLQYYSGNIRKALMHLYPNIGLDPTKFIYLSKNYWLDEQNRKSFFVDFAKKRGFDPHVTENWSHIPVTSIYHMKRGAMALRYYNGSLMSAVKSLFP